MGEGKGRVKGVWVADAIGAFLRIAPDARGRIAEAIESLSPSLRPGFDPRSESFGILTASWYPEELLHAAIDAMIRDLDGTARERLAAQLAEAVSAKTLRGVYRVFFRLLATPQRFCENVERLWTTSHDTGTLSATLLDPRTVETRVDDWRGHHPFVCRVNRYIAVEMFKGMGLRGVKADAKCRSDVGGRVCTTRFTWER
jgi:hypothetical protein